MSSLPDPIRGREEADKFRSQPLEKANEKSPESDGGPRARHRSARRPSRAVREQVDPQGSHCRSARADRQGHPPDRAHLEPEPRPAAERSRQACRGREARRQGLHHRRNPGGARRAEGLQGVQRQDQRDRVGHRPRQDQAGQPRDRPGPGRGCRQLLHGQRQHGHRRRAHRIARPARNGRRARRTAHRPLQRDRRRQLQLPGERILAGRRGHVLQDQQVRRQRLVVGPHGRHEVRTAKKDSSGPCRDL